MISTPGMIGNGSGLAKGEYRVIGSPMGDLAIVHGADGSLRTTWLALEDRRLLRGWRENPRLEPALASKLAAYFRGQAIEFSNVPTPRGPAFFARCWQACRRIPRGRTISYAQLAKAAGGGVSASRAAGQAMRRNPLPIIVPCHRVVGADGSLHGYAGSLDGRGDELHVKRSLLELEGALQPLSTA
jgi:methylated-DNA-[protein]-cysteine S-methyltransferase